MSADGSTKVGKISKQWTGLVKEYFTDADNFGVSFPMDLDVRMKAVTLAACFLIVSIALILIKHLSASHNLKLQSVNCNRIPECEQMHVTRLQCDKSTIQFLNLTNLGLVGTANNLQCPQRSIRFSAGIKYCHVSDKPTKVLYDGLQVKNVGVITQLCSLILVGREGGEGGETNSKHLCATEQAMKNIVEEFGNVNVKQSDQ